MTDTQPQTSLSDELLGLIKAGKPRVLLVDDDKGITDTLKDILEDEHYEVFTANNGAEARAHFKEHVFNAIVLDFNLPDTNGLELAREMRAINPETTSLLITGQATLEMAVKAIKEAIYDYLIKPVDPGQLQRTLTRALEKQKLTLENVRLMKDIQRLDRMKSKMLSVLSHDLRTPLASVRGYAELLRSGQKGKVTDDQKRLLDIILQEADQMNAIIIDLLDLGSIEGGKLKFEPKTASIEDIINKAVPRVRILAGMKEIDLAVEVAPGLSPVHADPGRILQALSSILVSSVKHTQHGGRVYISALPVGTEAVEVRVKDNGSGFSREDIEDIFNWYERTRDQKSVGDGLGLGLAIAREIIGVHEGKIGADSEGLGKGATFWFRLPLAKETPPAQQPG